MPRHHVLKQSQSFRAIMKRQEEEQRKQRSSSPFQGSGLSVEDPDQALLGGSITIFAPGLLLVDGGDFILLNETLVEVLRVGIMQHGDRGYALRREDGTLAQEMRKAFGPGDPTQAFLTRDRLGRITGGDSLVAASGMDAPHIPITFRAVDLTSGARAQSTTSTTFVPLFEADEYRQNPGLRLKVKAWCSDGTTSGEIQVWDAINSVYLDTAFGAPPPSVITIPTGTTAATAFTSESMLLPGAMSDDMRLEVHVRRTAGAGTVNVAIARSIGYFI